MGWDISHLTSVETVIHSHLLKPATWSANREGGGDETHFDQVIDGLLGICDELQQRLGAGDGAAQRSRSRSERCGFTRCGNYRNANRHWCSPYDDLE